MPASTHLAERGLSGHALNHLLLLVLADQRVGQQVGQLLVLLEQRGQRVDVGVHRLEAAGLLGHLHQRVGVRARHLLQHQLQHGEREGNAAREEASRSGREAAVAGRERRARRRGCPLAPPAWADRACCWGLLAVVSWRAAAAAAASVSQRPPALSSAGAAAAAVAVLQLLGGVAGGRWRAPPPCSRPAAHSTPAHSMPAPSRPPLLTEAFTRTTRLAGRAATLARRATNAGRAARAARDPCIVPASCSPRIAGGKGGRWGPQAGLQGASAGAVLRPAAPRSMGVLPAFFRPSPATKRSLELAHAFWASPQAGLCSPAVQAPCPLACTACPRAS